jgi:tape measure domain-containing protein
VAADSTVRLIVDAAKAVNPLRAVAATSKKAEQAIEKLKGAVERTTRKFSQLKTRATDSLRSIAKKARDAAAATGKFGKAAIAAAAAAIAIGGIKFAFTQAGELEKATKSLQVLTGSLDTAKGIISELQDFGAVTPFTSSELIETGKRLKAFGFETEKIVDVTKRLADVAGATGADLGGIATAFGQIQAKGRLQGEELLQLQERGVSLQDELQKMYGLTGDEFRKALEGGRISADAVNLALVKLTEAGGKYANGAIAQSDTLFGKLSTLQDALQRFGQNIGKVLSPIFKGIIDFLTTVTNQINNLFGEMARNTAIDRKARENLGLPAAGGGRLKGTDRVRLRNEKELLRAGGFGTNLLNKPTAPDMTVPELLAARGGAGTGESAAKKEEAERLRILKERQQIMRQINEEELTARAAFEGDLDALGKENRLLLAKLEGREEEQRLQERLNELKEKHEGFDTSIFEVLINQGKEYKKQIDLSKQLEDQQKKAAERLAETYRTIGDAIKTGVVDSLTAAVEGTKSLAEVASNTLRSLGNTLIKLGLNTAFGALGESGGLLGKLFGGGKANGGTVAGGRSYMVGERGPELFTPGRTGSIAPNSAISSMGSIVVNVDAKGTSAQGDSSQAKLVGEAIGSAVRQELLRQKRPGGLLS